MDTWWKNLMYNKMIKRIALVGVYIAICIMIFCGNGIYVFENHMSYFDSVQFKEQFVKKAGYVRDWIVRYDEDRIFSEVTQNQIDQYLMHSSVDTTQQEAIDGIIADRRSYYSKIINELDTTNKNLDYLAVDITTGRYITNLEGTNLDEQIKELTSRDNYLIGNGYYILNLKYGTGGEDSYYSDQYTMDMNYYAGDKFEGQDNYRIYVALKNKADMVSGDDFYIGYRAYERYIEQKNQLYSFCMVAVIVGIILGIYLVAVIGKDDACNGIKMNQFDNLSLELQCIIGALVYCLFVMLYHMLQRYFGISPLGILEGDKGQIGIKLIRVLLLFMVYSLPITVCIATISSVIKHIKNHTLMEHLWCYRIGRDFYNTVGTRTRVIIILMIVGGVNIIVGIVLAFILKGYWYSYGILCFLPMVIWNLICGIMIMKWIVDYKKILQVAQAITEGELDRKVELRKSLPVFKEMAETVNSMGTGLEKAVGESLKSERLKTELITNVSHDLKTPLTSIISYIDLLKDEKIENATAREYINVLDERSHRLKQLVEDLVEASKAVTGNIKAEVDILHLDELVRQALGEYQDRIEANHLMVVCDQIEDIVVWADGRHMWRIVENLLSNVCKYAMPHTRVYVEVYSKDGEGYCTIKNISKEPLNINPKELTERFVRGDASRTTEGSGLGLAIAQSLILIQNGLMDITIDGDLFKVTVKVPLVENDSEDITLEKNG